MIVRRFGVRGRLLAVAGTALVALVAGCFPATDEADGPPEPTPRADGPAPGLAVPPGDNPLAGMAFFVDPDTPAAGQKSRWVAGGRTDDAAQIDKIASRPIAYWLTAADPAEITAEVDAVVRRAGAAGQMPVLVAYHVPQRDCGSYSAGGAASADEYRTWIRAVAAGIGSQAATVVVEPDAVAHALDGCKASATDRFALLDDAVTVLKQGPATRVYLDAGNPTWIRDTGALADALRRAGVERADGFALNVSNFVSTPDNVEYGGRLAQALGGARFVIDTSRNGAGPWPDGTEVDGGPSWCNPPGRALGAEPTSDTGLSGVDALLWIKRPGDSDGACRPGEPVAGEWWPDYALGLASRS
ncbi:glycoside hydrolase family 6 protein [Polymorphospora rubra]|uniref:glycoside hydrolase family 6 protein n=1 Tax=Polymorphospora rubra TaxID=338584 RepID=UPI0033DFB137